MSNETGTVQGTTEYEDFRYYVEGKFGSMANLSMHLVGNRTSLLSVFNIRDNDKGRTRIWWLNKKAHELKYDKLLVYISEKDIKQIRYKVIEILYKENIILAEWLRSVKFKRYAYDSIVNGINIFKNESYGKLMKILFNN